MLIKRALTPLIFVMRYIADNKSNKQCRYSNYVIANLSPEQQGKNKKHQAEEKNHIKVHKKISNKKLINLNFL